MKEYYIYYIGHSQDPIIIDHKCEILFVMTSDTILLSGRL